MEADRQEQLHGDISKLGCQALVRIGKGPLLQISRYRLHKVAELSMDNLLPVARLKEEESHLAPR